MFAAEFSLVIQFLPGRFTAWPGTDFVPIFSPRKSPGWNVPGHLETGLF